jgi:hypothetical protein
MTETLFVMVTAFAGLLFTDPFYGGALTKASIAKWPLLGLALGALGFHLLGRAITDPRRLRGSAGAMLTDWWPALVLALFVIGGSVFARLADAVKDNFMGFGVGMLFLPTAAVAIDASAHRSGLLKALGVTYLFTALGMLVIILITGRVMHEEIFLVVPLGAYFLCAPRLRWWQVPLGLLLIGGSLVSVKNTTFLLVLLTLVGCGFVWLVRMVRRNDRLAFIIGLYLGVPAVVGGATALYLTYRHYQSSLPDGSVKYRVEMYTIAWNRFLDSPIWGTFFTDSSVTYFSLYRTETTTQFLPTHSDILDLMAHGGMLALGLWLLVVWRVLTIGWGAVLRLAHAEVGNGAMRGWRCLLVLAMVQVCAIITYAVNPPLINLTHGFWIWGTTGAMWALHRSLIGVDERLRVPVRGWARRVPSKLV